MNRGRYVSSNEREKTGWSGHTLLSSTVIHSLVFVFFACQVCPNEAPGLADTHSAEFEALYLSYEAIPGKARKVVKARDVWQAILDCQTETGTPYMLFKDASVARTDSR